METPLVRRHWPATILAALLAFVAYALTADRTGTGETLARASYDALHVFQPGPDFTRSNCPVVLVYLDLDSHLQLRQSPAARWDRSLHTRLINRLTEAGARAVVFDIVFDTPWASPEVDSDLAAAIRRNGHVILAAERRRSERATGRAEAFEVRRANLPQPDLLNAAWGCGFAELAVDPDFVVRRTLPWLESPADPTLVRAAARALSGMDASDETRLKPSWTRYYGPPLSLPYVSFRAALEPGGVDPTLFRDRVVFVGARPMVGAFGERRDELRHPYPAWSAERNPFMPGVEIHATQFLNWLRKDGLQRTSARRETALGIGAALLLAWGFMRLRPLPGAVLAVVTALSAWGLAQTAFVQLNLWSPWLVVGAVLAPGGWLVTAAYRTHDWRRQRRLFEQRRRADAHRIERQATLIERARDLILVTDLEGRIRYANPSARRLLGVPSDTPSPLAPLSTTVQVADFAATRSQLLERGEWSGVITWGGSPEESTARLIDSRWTLLRETPEETASILVIGTDVTERHRLEADFLRAQKWEAIGSLAGGMAHDLNNTLAPALLGLQVLQQAESREDTRRLLAMVEAHTRRGTETVQQVLGFLRGRPATLAELEPAALIRELEILVRSSFPRNIRVASLIPSQVGRIRGNATQLHQALLNLCLNARDAMPDGGELTFVLDDVDLSETEATTYREGRAGPFVLIAVSDTGTGIAPENLQRIFDPLFTTKDPGRGTGLGLASVLRIVQHHEGFFGVSSDVGAGTTFELYLPRIISSTSHGSGPTENTPPNSSASSPPGRERRDS